MNFDMVTTKVTITLPTKQIDEIRALVAAGSATSLSGFVKHAVTMALADAQGWRKMLQDALDETGGPLTKHEKAWTDAALSCREHKRSSRREKAV
jgi:Arc/MetJ-type ribon-helix-helix transcriptional regulator